MQETDKTREMNERLLVEVRRRLQAAKSQLNSRAPSEDAGSPVESPLGGRPTVLQGRDASGTAAAHACLPAASGAVTRPHQESLCTAVGSSSSACQHAAVALFTCQHQSAIT